MVEEAQNSVPVLIEPPLGMHNGRLDDKGRLKLPVDFQAYLGSLTEKRLFVTSIDRSTAQIYTLSVWRENERRLRESKDPKLAKALSFTASDLGDGAVMDSLGRVLFNPELRRQLKMDGSALRLYFERGHIQVLTEAVYEKQKQAYTESGPEALEMMEMEGFQ